MYIYALVSFQKANFDFEFIPNVHIFENILYRPGYIIFDTKKVIVRYLDK